MTGLVAVLAALAGGFGAVARYALDSRITRRVGGPFPWGTVIINVSGSFALGLVTGLADAHVLDASGALVLGAGFLGGYTTFSTASVQAAELFARRRTLLGGSYAGGMLGAALLAAAAGLALSYAWGSALVLRE